MTPPPCVSILSAPSLPLPGKIVPFFNYIDLSKDHGWRVYTTASDFDTNDFTLTIDKWSDTILYAAQAGWIAYPADRECIFSTSVNTMDVRPWDKSQLQQSAQISFGDVEFCQTPAVFVELNWMDIDHTVNLRLKAYVNNVTSTGLEWHIDSWNPVLRWCQYHHMRHGKYCSSPKSQIVVF